MLSPSAQSPTILVAYATRYGSTTEVAHSIAETLRTHALAVDVEPMRAVRNLEPYQAVILGAPLYIGSWPKEAHTFLVRHQESLQQRPLALFTLGPIRQEEAEWEDVRNQLQQQMEKYTWLQPVALKLFGGKIDPMTLGFPDNLLTKLPGTPLHDLPPTDERDWDAIRAWAESLVIQLQLATPQGEEQPA